MSGIANTYSFAPIVQEPHYETVAQKYRPIFQRIAANTLEREQNRRLGREEIKWLKEAGFGAVRVPVEYGGDGVSLPQLFQLLIELAEADSNIVQALRGHFAFVEDRLNAPRDEKVLTWFKRFTQGDLVGNAWSEVGSVSIGEVNTRVSKQDGSLVVNGQKFYSTGSIFADWIDLFARDEDGSHVIAAVSTHQASVIQEDDWDGFGQRTTGSGTSIYQNAVVEELIPFESRFKYQTAFYQLFHLATLAGIARAALRDVSGQIRGRTRIYSTSNASSFAQDVQVQQVVGEISAYTYAAEATAVRAAFASQRAYDAHWHGTPEQEKQANIEAELESAQGQVVLSELVIKATSQLFNALGASAASTKLSLDRHWRNARTVASHNPLIYKARIIGDWQINGTEPPYVWKIGQGPSYKPLPESTTSESSVSSTKAA